MNDKLTVFIGDLRDTSAGVTLIAFFTLRTLWPLRPDLTLRALRSLITGFAFERSEPVGIGAGIFGIRLLIKLKRRFAVYADVALFTLRPLRSGFALRTLFTLRSLFALNPLRTLWTLFAGVAFQ